MMLGQNAYKAEPMSGVVVQTRTRMGLGSGISAESGLVRSYAHDPSPYFLSGPPDADGDGYSTPSSLAWHRCSRALRSGFNARCQRSLAAGLRCGRLPDLLNVVDYITFIYPFRPNDGHGEFNKFGHALDDDGDTVIEPNEDPPSQGCSLQHLSLEPRSSASRTDDSDQHWRYQQYQSSGRQSAVAPAHGRW
jgi:hypothetical protein